MPKRYYTLLSREPRQQWCIAFGDYSRRTVGDEMADMRYEATRGGRHTNTEYRIIITGDAQAEIRRAVEELNGIVADPVRAGVIAGLVMIKINGARNDSDLAAREWLFQASIARRVGANEFETIRTAIMDRFATVRA